MTRERTLHYESLCVPGRAETHPSLRWSRRLNDLSLHCVLVARGMHDSTSLRQHAIGGALRHSSLWCATSVRCAAAHVTSAIQLPARLILALADSILYAILVFRLQLPLTLADEESSLKIPTADDRNFGDDSTNFKLLSPVLLPDSLRLDA